MTSREAGSDFDDVVDRALGLDPATPDQGLEPPVAHLSESKDAIVSTCAACGGELDLSVDDLGLIACSHCGKLVEVLSEDVATAMVTGEPLIARLCRPVPSPPQPRGSDESAKRDSPIRRVPHSVDQPRQSTRPLDTEGWLQRESVADTHLVLVVRYLGLLLIVIPLWLISWPYFAWMLNLAAVSAGLIHDPLLGGPPRLIEERFATDNAYGAIANAAELQTYMHANCGCVLIGVGFVALGLLSDIRNTTQQK